MQVPALGPEQQANGVPLPVQELLYPVPNGDNILFDQRSSWLLCDVTLTPLQVPVPTPVQQASGVATPVQDIFWLLTSQLEKSTSERGGYRSEPTLPKSCQCAKTLPPSVSTSLPCRPGAPATNAHLLFMFVGSFML